ncbi:MAG: hypothetical protein BGO78_10610 [Chloroflexi bacterium 44-23]|nr:MAG: hypothetical protein BGO78_10610 [Chloroflexi bacterium 44-23]
MAKKIFVFYVVLLSISMLSACASADAQAIRTIESTLPILTPINSFNSQTKPTTIPTASAVPPLTDAPVVIKAIPTRVIQPTATLAANDWQNFPIFPTSLSQQAREIYTAGIAAGNDPQRFSKIGDCQNINTYFLALFDDPNAYTLGEQYQDLQATIDYYAGSWSRQSISVRGGFNVATIFNPWFSNKEFCGENETPIDCELRVNKPSVVLISMEAWWNGDPARYAMHLRRIVDTVLAHNALPILATKADNLEGNYEINRAIVQIAYEYDLPLWNFWRAVQDIPRKGLEDDMFHLTHGLNDFSNTKNLRQGWPVRNLTALQTIDAVRRALETP